MKDRCTLSRVILLPTFVIMTALLSATPTNACWQVLPRLCLAFSITQLLPGWLVLTRTGWFDAAEGTVERLLLSYAISYVLTTFVDIGVTIFQLDVNMG